MNEMLRADPVDYDNISEQVRGFCTQRLYELEKGLRPLVDGTFGEVLPGHLAGYLTTIRQLGKLYQAEKPPRDLQNLVPVAKVQEVLARMREQHEADVAAAVAAAELRVREELSHGSRRSIESAQTMIMGKLEDLEKRQGS